MTQREKAELALLGKCVSVESENDTRIVTQIILRALGKGEHYKGLDIYTELHRYNKDNKVTHISTSTVYGMPCINYCIDPQDGETPKPFEEDYGTGYQCSFCYVFNTKDPLMGSEFGDCFFEKRQDGYYHRVS